MSRRRTTTLMPAAAAAVGALLLGGCGSADDGEAAPAPTPTPSAFSSPSTAALELALPPTAPGRCAVPNARVLASMDVVFEGTVTRADDSSATLEVERWFTGGEADLVSVVMPSQQLREGGYAVDFQEGRTYLVSAANGSVSLCGFSAETSPELEATYEEAFPGR